MKITCSVSQTNLTYGKDYLLGDRVSIKLPEYRLSATAQIVSVTTVYEYDGKTVAPTFGNFILEGDNT